MTKKIYSAAVPALRLTAQDDLELRMLSKQLEQEILSQYEDFLFRDRRSFDVSKWKFVRAVGDVHVYKEHRDKHRLHAHTPSFALHRKEAITGPQERLAQQSVRPRILANGTIPGTLDDVMYGMSFHDTLSLQAFWASQRDTTEESAVVATLDDPTLEDPYRFLGAIWFLQAFPFNIFHRRDSLALASRSITRLSNGERVGVVISHSIEHRDLPELQELNTIRATSSILTVFRQHDKDRVEMFMIHFLDTKGSMPEVLHVRESLMYSMPLAASADNVGFRRKLSWLVQDRKRERAVSTPCNTIEPQGSGTSDYCELCDKKIGTLLTSPGTSCELCYIRICSRCRVSHDLVVRTLKGRTILKEHDFCVHCSLRARAVSTFWVAREEVQQYQGESPPIKQRKRALTTLLSEDSLRSLT